MEGAAIAHICTRYGVPMVEMRGISNIVEDRDRGRWNIRLAADNCQQAAQDLLRIV
jgi:futalosine hydrolase